MGDIDFAKLAKAAMDYGPFFFAILVFVWASRSFRKRYNDAVSDHAENEEFIKHAKIQDSIVLYLGISIIIACIVWWFFQTQQPHIFTGKFIDLEDYMVIDSETLYFREEPLKNIAKNLAPRRNEHFLAVIHGSPKGKLSIRFSKGSDNETRLYLDCTEGEENCFKIDYDEQEGKNKLVRCEGLGSKMNYDWFLPKEAFARTRGDYAALPSGNIMALNSWKVSSTKDYRLNHTKRISPQSQAILRDLSNERTSVGKKIGSIDKLLKCKSCLAECLAVVPTGSEPFILTIYDLTNHSDPELASKAKKVFRRINASQYLVYSLKTGIMRPPDICRILLRMEKPDSLIIGQHVANQTGNKIIVNLVNKIRKGQLIPRNLMPIGTRDGDRYYIKAVWDRRDQKTIYCLTNLFNKRVQNQRTLAQEKSLMNDINKKRNYRLVFWYSKSWALDMARRIEGCGAKAYFVSRGY